ncbi:MAG: DUF1700 domain-containing protein [Acholeplasma sp.]|nr:DUF1700 domain-containing protein [Acholeplasma sp.]
MEKILKKIEHELRGLEKSERENIISYYEEMINDRLENNESLKEIDESFNYKAIRKEHLPEILNKRYNKNIKDSMRTSAKLLLFLFASPILIPLAVVYLAVLVVIFSMILTGVVLMITVPLAIIAFIVERLISGEAIIAIILATGVLLFVGSLLMYGLYYFTYAFKKLNDYLIKAFSNILLRKGGKHENI